MADEEDDDDADSVLNFVENDDEFGEIENDMIHSFDILNEARVAAANEQDINEQKQFEQAMANIDTAPPAPSGDYNLVNGMEELNNLTPEEMASMFDDSVSMHL